MRRIEDEEEGKRGKVVKRKREGKRREREKERQRN